MQKIVQTPTWCPGCGTYVVSAALKKAISDLQISPKNVVVCYDIGCSGNMVNVLDVCGIATLHGRSIPFASGVSSARPELTVIAQAGDGGLLSEGLNHFVHAIARNDNITLVVNNNLIFGLTAGQPSCATPKEVISPYASDKSRVDPLSIVDLAVINGAKFVARAPETDLGLIQEVIKEAITFKGFAIVEIIQPCKIWARGAKQIKFRKISKPFSDSKKLIGKSDLVGLLYREN